MTKTSLAAALVAAAGLSTAACRGERATPASETTPAAAVTSSAEVADSLVLRLDGVTYALTDSGYAKWKTASERLAQLPQDRSTINPHVENLRAIDAEDVENTIRNLEGDSDARRTISSAGLRVREYVMQTLALHQALTIADSATSLVRWQNVPPANIVFAQERKAEVNRLRVNQRFRVVDDDPDDADDARALRERVRKRLARAASR